MYATNMFIGFLISISVFLVCFYTAVGKKRRRFLNVTLITLLLLCGGGLLVVLPKIFPDGWPRSVDSGWEDAVINVILFGPYLPGVASIMAKMAVVFIGKPVADENPYEDS